MHDRINRYNACKALNHRTWHISAQKYLLLLCIVNAVVTRCSWTVSWTFIVLPFRVEPPVVVAFVGKLFVQQPQKLSGMRGTSFRDALACLCTLNLN